jgi:hypothetical protein
MDNGHWQYTAEIDFEEWFGFIYRIVEISTGREYLGKKQFKSYTKKKVAGRKNKKSVVKQSDWKKYTGSSKHLNKAIEDNGMENYAFFIESLHTTRGSLFYAEVETQIKENVLRELLEDGITPKYFNKQVAGVRFIPPLESTAEQYTNIKNYDINTEYGEYLGTMIGDKNPRWGEKDVKNGLTYEQYYGEERSAEMKQKLREHNLGKPSPNKDVNFHTPEQIEKWKNDERRIHKGEDNGMFGKPCHYKMTEEEKQRWKDNVGKSIKGIKRSEETKTKMRESAKTRDDQSIECPYCHLVGQPRNLRRYHFDYCKQNPDALPRPEVKKKECPHCNITIDMGNYTKYHGKNCKHK